MGMGMEYGFANHTVKKQQPTSFPEAGDGRNVHPDRNEVYSFIYGPIRNIYDPKQMMSTAFHTVNPCPLDAQPPETVAGDRLTSCPVNHSHVLRIEPSTNQANIFG
jgi:hypothetical protein